MKHPIIKFGLIGGFILVILGQAQWQIGGTSLSYSAAEALGYLSIVLALSSIYFAVRKYRDEIGDGFITFPKAFKIGTLTALIPSIFMFVSTVIFHLTSGNEFKEWAMAEMSKTMTEEQFAAYSQQLQENQALYENPFFQGIIMFMTVFVLGLIISSIVALILKNEKRNSNKEAEKLVRQARSFE